MLENILPTNAYIIGLKLFTIIYMADSKWQWVIVWIINIVGRSSRGLSCSS